MCTSVVLGSMRWTSLVDCHHIHRPSSVDYFVDVRDLCEGRMNPHMIVKRLPESNQSRISRQSKMIRYIREYDHPRYRWIKHTDIIASKICPAAAASLAGSGE